MKMSKKLILASVVLPLVLSSSAFAFGEKDHKRPHNECRPSFFLDREMMKELNLTDNQKEQFKALRHANKEEMRKRMDEHKELGEKGREEYFDKANKLLMADKFDPAKATQLAQEMAEKQVKRQVDMLNKQHKMLSILTPEQKHKFTELQKERLEDCDDMPPRHHGKDHR